jgi:D-alanyl-D-alanine carboxypeptidase
VVTSSLAAPAEHRPGLRRALDELTRTAACGAVVHVDDEHGIWSAGSGLADVAARRPCAPGDCFRAGSIVKTFVATTLLQLVGEGQLRLSDAVQQWLPDLLPDGAEITVRQLLNHTSGLFNSTEAMPVSLAELVGTGRLRTVHPRELVRRATEHEPYFAPGAGWHYSNTNYTLAGLLIERITGHSYEDELRQRLIVPLGLRHTDLPGTSPFMPAVHLRAYLWPRSGDPLDITVQNPSRAWASGDLIATASDLSRFFAELFAGHLLAPDLMAELRQTVPGTNNRHYGLGTFRMSLPGGLQTWGYSGAYGGYLTFALRAEDNSRGLTIALTPRSDAAMPGILGFATKFFTTTR